MKRLVSQLRNQPLHVRERIAWFTTIGIVVVVIVIVLIAKSTVNFQAPNESADATNSVRPFELIKNIVTDPAPAETSSANE